MMTRSTLLIAALMLGGAPAAHAQTLKIATVAPDGTAWMKEIRAGAERIEALTGGRVKMKFYPGAVMGNEQSVLRKIRIGQLHGGAFTGGGIAEIDANTRVYNLPMLFRNLAEVHYVRERMDDMLRDSLVANGLVAVGIGDGGLGYVMLREPARDLESLRSHRVWIPEGDPVSAEVFRLAGIQAVPLPLADVYTGLQTGLLDTVVTTPTAAIAFQWHTRINHVIDFPLGYINGYLVISDKAFARLRPADREVLRDVMRDVFLRLDEHSRRDNAEALNVLRTNGVEVIELSREEKNRWLEIALSANRNMVQAGTVSNEFWERAAQHLAAFRSQVRAAE